MAGKAGEMKDSDFEALFALIDEDGSGEIDFTEFSAFMVSDVLRERGRVHMHLSFQADAYHSYCGTICGNTNPFSFLHIIFITIIS